MSGRIGRHHGKETSSQGFAQERPIRRQGWRPKAFHGEKDAQESRP
jgi:hypothetical protein